MGFSAIFTFQLDNTKKETLSAPYCRNGSLDIFGHDVKDLNSFLFSVLISEVMTTKKIEILIHRFNMQ